jgi:hypothetical protein
VRLAAAVVVLGGCGFDPAPSGGDGPAGDASGDGSTFDANGDAPDAVEIPGCFDLWMAGPVLGTQTAVVATGASESDPFLTDDELTIYFGSGGDIRVATRTSIGDPFGVALTELSLSSPSNDYKASLTGDSLTAFVSTRSGGSSVTNIRRGTRGDTTQPFVMDSMYLGAVNDGVDQWDSHISRDGLRLYLSPNNGPQQHVAVAVRASDTSSFTASQTISELASVVKDNDHSLTADERVVVFASDRTGMRQLHYAVRASPTGTFGAPVVLPGVPTGDDGPHLSSDGCRLYFVSDRNGSNDVFVAPVM